jgi:hypothetical protein
MQMTRMPLSEYRTNREVPRCLAWEKTLKTFKSWIDAGRQPWTSVMRCLCMAPARLPCPPCAAAVTIPCRPSLAAAGAPHSLGVSKAASCSGRAHPGGKSRKGMHTGDRFGHRTCICEATCPHLAAASWRASCIDDWRQISHCISQTKVCLRSWRWRRLVQHVRIMHTVNASKAS